MNIPFFYLNSEILIPKILKPKGVEWYVLGIIIAVFIWGCITIFIRTEIFQRNSAIPSYGVVFQMLFVLAISTSYKIFSDYLANEQKMKDQENERLKSELGFLRSQISPHFMFNVLNSIVSLARKKSDLIEPVTIKLSELMRYMLYEVDEEKVSMEKELKYLQSYIDLQKLRFGNDVAFNFEVINQISNKTIEPMLLIPFVENAFKHGVGLIKNPVIDVKLDVQQSHIYFEVRNKVSRQFVEVTKNKNSGIGLVNVRRRLELLYPKNHELTIEEEGEWYEVKLKIFFLGSWESKKLHIIYPESFKCFRGFVFLGKWTTIP